ncbi:WD40 repeat-like protein [Punctularia strigosozonata HHB-11173 SS5]|uniref:WD40 repeat-like protein n=1 Tax=Punctularia strigosozonata (strain HHB-11173) TaxID=741275 RepID=UPI000441861D|nr:WD40 repeat-like protein [Punctularia strigosozonata HHB-11173 SS5]EIN06262.1 WD40 repeat-like protein [Punctularia strigosozonata HHB-11173 SS5]
MAPTQRPTKRQRTTEHHTKSIARVKPSQVSLKKPAPATTPSARKPTTVRTPASDKGKAKAERLQESLPSSFKVIAGSYEKLLYGLQGTVSRTEDGGYDWKLKPIFIFPAHVSCIKAVAASPNGGKWLATGSADEIIKVWDLRRRKEIGGLMHHEGSITHLSFPSRSHLLSASEDGSLCLFRARDWAVLRSMKGHKGRVNCVAVHPSGKVALSVGKDRTLRMWDLMRGKGSASTKLGKEGEVVRWSVSGALFVVQSQSTIDIYSTNMALLHTISHPSRIHDVCFVKRPSCSDSKTEIDVHELLLVGAEDKKLSVYDVPPTVDAAKDVVPTFVAELVGHSNRCATSFLPSCLHAHGSCAALKRWRPSKSRCRARQHRPLPSLALPRRTARSSFTICAQCPLQRHRSTWTERMAWRAYLRLRSMIAAELG